MQTKELIPMDDLGVFVNAKYEMLIDSRKVAEYFGKRHDHVLRDIDALVETDCSDLPNFGEITHTKAGLDVDFAAENFIKSTYKDEYGRTQRRYLMTRNGFIMLVMGYTGKKAMAMKQAYIRRFDKMEAQILYLQSLRDQYLPLTDAIQLAHAEPKFYHYSNEADMLNRLVTGMSAKQLRASRGIPKDEPLRPHLTLDEIGDLDYLQRLDVGFVLAIPDFQQRKQRLEYLLMKRREKMSAKALPAS